MKILLASSLPFSYAGGVKTHLSHLQRALATADIDFDLINTGEAKAIGTVRGLRSRVNFNRSGLFNVWAQSQKVRLMRRSIRQRLEAGDYDVIHAHDVYAAYAAWLEVRRRVPLLFTMHGPMSYEMLAVGEKNNSWRIKRLRAYEKIAYTHANKCIAVDSGHKSILVQDYLVPEERVEVVHNAVDVDTVLADCAHVEKIDLPDVFFILPRRLVPKNGVEYAIRALNLCQNKHHLVIAGDGPQLDYLNLIARQCGVEDRVCFAGNLEASSLMPLINRSVAVIVPSVPVAGVIEATSLSVLEAMALRRPLIASKIGGIWEILRSEENAFLTAPGDVAAIAQAMDALLTLKQTELERRAQRNFEILMQHHSLPVWQRKMLDIYTGLCHG